MSQEAPGKAARVVNWQSDVQNLVARWAWSTSAQKGFDVAKRAVQLRRDWQPTIIPKSKASASNS
ncbi:hypothetical protein Trco_002946 [Trichoderma cornu-damae]|uniref:Uncharacterized protein n=1 Tax=Trichoderma cornu-damae TaxID=654480 RepID=A0A9P8QTS9_9HYPO|nr:hypothetical protein Trco_002946 [Trichoderma cornu-damae]